MEFFTYGTVIITLLPLGIFILRLIERARQPDQQQECTCTQRPITVIHPMYQRRSRRGGRRTW